MDIKHRLAGFIVKYRIVIFLLTVCLAALSVTTIGRTRINYDLVRYLSKDTMTHRALNVMQQEFGNTEQLRLMFEEPEGAAPVDMDAALASLNDQEYINIARYDPEADVQTDGGTTYRLVTVLLNECDSAQAVRSLRALFPQAKYYVGGSAASLLDVQASLGREIPFVMIIAVVVVLGVLLLTSHAWIEPLLIIIALAISIIINMGTNFVFPDVSFITFAVSPILQLALSIDYAIMLLHSYDACAESGLAPEDAMREALAQCFMRISSSALTTIAGLMSLLFMSFTIGFDIGLVLSKGIIISMLGVFMLMPALVLIARRALNVTRHKPLPMFGAPLAHMVLRIRKPLAVLLIIAVICGAALSTQNRYTFTSSGDMSSVDSIRIDTVFGNVEPLVLLVTGGDEDSDYEKQRLLADRLCELRRADGTPIVDSLTAMVTTGAQALEYYTPQQVSELTGMGSFAVNMFFAMNGFGETVRADRLLAAATTYAPDNEQIAQLNSQLTAARELFNGPEHTRMLLNVNSKPGDDDFMRCMDDIIATAREVYGEDFYITGMGMSNYDISNAFSGDMALVNIITLLALLLIVALSFRSLRIAALLVFVIEGAIWITMGISRALGQSIFFMSYLICLSIQMGATIDYGILLCDQYRSNLGEADRAEALARTLKAALPTILTSGIILVTAGYIIGRVCSVYYISAIGLLLARGASISVLLVLTLLPALALNVIKPKPGGSAPVSGSPEGTVPAGR